jgi:hypothetical protein
MRALKDTTTTDLQGKFQYYCLIVRLVRLAGCFEMCSQEPALRDILATSRELLTGSAITFVGLSFWSRTSSPNNIRLPQAFASAGSERRKVPFDSSVSIAPHDCYQLPQPECSNPQHLAFLQSPFLSSALFNRSPHKLVKLSNSLFHRQQAD